MNRTTLFALTFSLLFVLNASSADKRYFIQFDRVDTEAENRVREVGGKIVHRFDEYRVVSAWLSEAAVQRMKDSSRVKKIELDPERHLMAQTVPYGIPMVQADLLSDEFSGNRKVCIIDSGFQKAHEDLQDARITSISMGAGPALVDKCGHGSHVAGIIAALDNEVGIRGIMPGNRLKLHIVKIFKDDCENTFASDLVQAVRVCRNAGSNVINMSLGGADASSVERTAFDDAFRAGVLSIAAAGNEGDTSFSFPASYDSVISVAAINSKRAVASFSQKNIQVDLAAPGVDVLSTVGFIDTNTATVDTKTYRGNWIEFAKRSAGVTGVLANGVLCQSPNSSWSGKIVLCKRGENTFLEKVQSVQSSGAIAAIIFNNAPGNFNGTLGDGGSSTIPAISLSKLDGTFLLNNKLQKEVKVISQRKQPANGYELLSGTSMASPHVAGIAALVWSNNTQWTNVQIRQALESTARDLGPPGKDNSSGFGLVQGKAALDFLRARSSAGNQFK
jgi:subtilisin family serine protease